MGPKKDPLKKGMTKRWTSHMDRANDKNIVDITGANSKVDFFLLHDEKEKTNL